MQATLGFALNREIRFPQTKAAACVSCYISADSETDVFVPFVFLIISALRVKFPSLACALSTEHGLPSYLEYDERVFCPAFDCLAF